MKRKLILALIIVSMLGLAIIPASAASQDPSGWAVDAIYEATQRGLLPEALQGSWAQPATRAEFAALAVALYEAKRGPITGRGSFTDTTDVYVEKAAYAGLVQGVGGNRFNPDGHITRQDAAVLLYRAANAIGSPFIAYGPGFADYDATASWALESISAVQAAGIMGGVGNNRFAPQDAFTREQSVVAVNRVFDFIEQGMGLVVARVNGINITASAVRLEIPGVLQELMWDYVEMFPDDTEFDFDRVFAGGLTFGESVLEYAARSVAYGILIHEFNARHGLFIDETSPRNWFWQIIDAVMYSPILLETFEEYMAECTMHQAEAKAEAILARALAGEDFSNLVELYGEDPGMAVNPGGYTFVRGVMVPEFEQATLALEIGEISGLVQSQFGIHIIMRVEPDPENVMRAFGTGPAEDGEELLAAKHILIMGGPNLEERVIEAVFTILSEKFDSASIEFLPALYDVPIG